MRHALLLGGALLVSVSAAAATPPSYRTTDCYNSRKSVDLKARSNGTESNFEFIEQGIHQSTPIPMSGGFKGEAHSIFRWKTEVEGLDYSPDAGDAADFGLLTVAMLPNAMTRTTEKWALVITHVSNRCWNHIKNFVIGHKIEIRITETDTQDAPAP